MATNRRRSTRSTRSSGLRSSAVKVYPAPAAGDATEAPVSTTAVNWDQEYHYIIKDLRQLAVISAGLVVVMLLIGFLI